jgi:hypothetical protein
VDGMNHGVFVKYICIVYHEAIVYGTYWPLQ